MKKMDQKKNKFNVAISKNSYCIALENAGERTRGSGDSKIENGLGYPGRRSAR